MVIPPRPLYLLAFTALLILQTTYAAALNVDSPDAKLRCIISPDSNGRLTFAVTRNGTSVVQPSPLGVTIASQDLGLNANLGTPATRAISETYSRAGGHSTATNQCNESLIPVTSGSNALAWTLEVRVFNDGAAYRYRVPGSGNRGVAGEASQWILPAGGTLYYQDAGNSSYESTFATSALSSLAVNTQVRTTAVAQLPGPLFVMMTEANLVGYSDMSLKYLGGSAFQALFRQNTNGWTATGEILSPWRVTVVAGDLNTLVNTDILPNLCPAPSTELATASWIKPGRSTWEWLVDGHPQYANQTGWVDRTAQLGFDYYLIDDGWKVWTSGTLDAWGCMKAVADYARTKSVGIWAWVHTNEVTTPAQRTAYFQKAKDAGLAGLKIDFMGAPDVGWVQWYDDTLRDAASYQLMVNFHGCVKPTGRERTYPHEMTREAINGRESGTRPSFHDSTLPFTRYVQGHADYTPTDFRGSKLGGNSYAHELAQAIVYTSPLLCYGGDPADYLKNSALDILQTIPPAWDETRVLSGSSIGQVAGFARRKGTAWYVGVINGATAGSLPISLSFLGSGNYVIDKLADSTATNAAWVRTRETVTNASSFTATLRAAGGFVARIVPAANLAAAPTGLTATATTGCIQVAWNTTPRATAYTIQRGTAPGGPYSNLASGLTMPSFTDTNIGANVRFYYTVFGTNAYGAGDSSAEVNAATASNGLASAWTDADIGSTGAVGYGAFYNGVYTVNGAGADLYGGNDRFHFLSQSWTGDGVLTARVVSLSNTDPWAKVGVMFRETTATNSKYAFTLLTPSMGVAFQMRTTVSSNTNVTGLSAPYWVRLVRTGDSFSSYASPDGQTWTQIGATASNPMATSLRVGLAVCSHSSGTLNTARFDNVSFLASPAAASTTPISESQLRLDWSNRSTGEEAISIERSPAGANNWSVIAGALPPGTTSYLDTGLAASTGYDYRVTPVAPGADPAYATINGSTPAGVGDGIPGSWRYQYFGNGLSAAGAAAATADADGDGMTNLAEYQAGTDPTSNASTFQVTTAALNGGNFLIKFTSVAGKNYAVETTSDLKNSAWAVVPGAQNLMGNGGEMAVTIGAIPASRFFRVIVL